MKILRSIGVGGRAEVDPGVVSLAAAAILGVNHSDGEFVVEESVLQPQSEQFYAQIHSRLAPRRRRLTLV